MIYTVTLNPSIDYVVKVEEFIEGNTNRSTYEKKIPGGKGIMVSKLLDSLGMNSCNLGFLGGITGGFIENYLKNQNIFTEFTEIKDDTRINIKLKSKVETEINARGPVIDKQEIEVFFRKLNKLNEEDTLVLSGSIPNSIDEDFYLQIIEKTRSKNIEFIIDTTGKQLYESLRFKPFLIKPNREELEDLLNIKISNLDEIPIYGKQLLELGAQNVIISLGKDGAMFFTKDISLYGLPVKGNLINSVGAGDSMIGGFLYGIKNKLAIEDCFKLAVASGTATAFSEDIGSKEFIEDIYKKVNIKKL